MEFKNVKKKGLTKGIPKWAFIKGHINKAFSEWKYHYFTKEKTCEKFEEVKTLTSKPKENEEVLTERVIWKTSSK